jgi:hypothetical protein
VSKAVAEDEGANYLQKTFVSALKMDPIIVKVHYKPRSVWYFLREKFGNQRFHYLIYEILSVETALRSHQVFHVKIRNHLNNRNHEF